MVTKTQKTDVFFPPKKALSHRNIEETQDGFIDTWLSLINLLKALKSFEVVEINGEVVLSPLTQDPQKDLQTIVNESSFLTNLQLFARVSENKTFLGLMR